MSHTPGPWKCAEEGEALEEYYTWRVFSLSDAEIAPANGYGETAAEAAANARLIAAAPEMLALLEEAPIFCTGDELTDGWGDRIQALLARIESANG